MKCNFTIKQFIEMLVFLIVVVIMVWQSKNTFETFIAGRTTFARSTEASDSVPPPTIVMCQKHRWKNGAIKEPVATFNISDKVWFFNQFNWLNDKLNITFTYGDGYNRIF